MPPGTRMMDSTDTANNAARLTDRLKAFANGTKVPRCLTVNDTELKRLESSAILPLLWSVFTSPHLEFAVYAAHGSNQDMQAWTISIHCPKEVPTPGTMFSLPTLNAIYEKELRQIMNTNTEVHGHGTG